MLSLAMNKKSLISSIVKRGSGIGANTIFHENDPDGIFHLSMLKWTTSEILLVLWHHLSTSLKSATIAYFVNHKFPGRLMKEEDVKHIISAMEMKFDEMEGSWGELQKFSKPREDGTCPCDFQEDCFAVKRRRKTRRDIKIATMLVRLFEGSHEELLACPRPHNAKAIHRGIRDRSPPPPGRHAWIRWMIDDTAYFFYRIWLFFRHLIAKFLYANVPQFLEAGAYILANFFLLNLFYTPLNQLSPVGQIISIFSHQFHGMPVTIAFVQTCVHFLVNYTNYRLQGRSAVEILQKEFIFRLLRWSLAAGILLFLSARLGMLESWKIAAHPAARDDFAGLENGWTGIPPVMKPTKPLAIGATNDMTIFEAMTQTVFP